MGNTIPQERIDEEFAAADTDNQGTLDTMKLKVAVERSLDKKLSTRALTDLIEKFDLNNDHKLNLEEFTNLCRDAEALDGSAEEGETLGEGFYDVVFTEPKLGLTVKDGPDGTIQVSRVTAAAVQGKVTPDDIMFAINGVALDRVAEVTGHKALAAKLATIPSRPITVTFKRL